MVCSGIKRNYSVFCTQKLLPIDEMHIEINPSKKKYFNPLFFFPVGSTRAGWDLIILPQDS